MTEDKIVEDPTYMEHIRHFFTDDDKRCMAAWIDLSTYEGVKRNYRRIYATTRSGSMPKDGERWSDARLQTFRNWIDGDFRRGIVEAESGPFNPPAGVRVRRNINDLSTDEFNDLKTAFDGIKSRALDDPNGFYQLAGIHWLPKKNRHCRHHEDVYNPWHRVYLLKFENALRSVEGCENVTLPYWDITESSVPTRLYEGPLASFTYPETLKDPTNVVRAEAGKPTERNQPEDILHWLDFYDVAGDIRDALSHPWWEKFNGWDSATSTSSAIILAHDSGHGACGVTVSDQNVAAFDPLFWIFHCNWDRLWWLWQQQYGATTLNAFKSHLEDDGAWLTDPIEAELAPFTHDNGVDLWLANETIDSHALGVGYEHPTAESEITPEFALPRTGRVEASRSFDVAQPESTSIRVKGIDRLNIPGSFEVSLLVDQKAIAQRAFFQPTTPRECDNCASKGTVNFDFVVPISSLAGTLTVEVNLIIEGRRRSIPLSACGNPTVNARLLLHDERP